MGVEALVFHAHLVHFQERALAITCTCTRAHAILHTQACLLAGAHKRDASGPDRGPRHRGRAWLEPSPLPPEVALASVFSRVGNFSLGAQPPEPGTSL